MTSVDDINSLESEAGIIASLIHKPDFIFYSEYLLPNHFTNKENRCVYTAIDVLVDGRFVEDLKDITLEFRGSSNQRIISMKEWRESFEKK